MATLMLVTTAALLLSAPVSCAPPGKEAKRPSPSTEQIYNSVVESWRDDTTRGRYTRDTLFPGDMDLAAIENLIDSIQLRKGNRVLLLGARCGHLALLFSLIVGRKGIVNVMERDEEKIECIAETVRSYWEKHETAPPNIHLFHRNIILHKVVDRYDYELIFLGISVSDRDMATFIPKYALNQPRIVVPDEGDDGQYRLFMTVPTKDRDWTQINGVTWHDKKPLPELQPPSRADIEDSFFIRYVGMGDCSLRYRGKSKPKEVEYVGHVDARSKILKAVNTMLRTHSMKHNVIVYIFGPAGVGKTFFPKWLRQRMAYDVPFLTISANQYTEASSVSQLKGACASLLPLLYIFSLPLFSNLSSLHVYLPFPFLFM